MTPSKFKPGDIAHWILSKTKTVPPRFLRVEVVGYAGDRIKVRPMGVGKVPIKFVSETNLRAVKEV